MRNLKLGRLLVLIYGLWLIVCPFVCWYMLYLKSYQWDSYKIIFAVLISVMGIYGGSFVLRCAFRR